MSIDLFRCFLLHFFWRIFGDGVFRVFIHKSNVWPPKNSHIFFNVYNLHRVAAPKSCSCWRSTPMRSQPPFRPRVFQVGIPQSCGSGWSNWSDPDFEKFGDPMFEKYADPDSNDKNYTWEPATMLFFSSFPDPDIKKSQSGSRYFKKHKIGHYFLDAQYKTFCGNVFETILLHFSWFSVYVWAGYHGHC